MVVSTVVVLCTVAWKSSIGCVNLNSCYGQVVVFPGSVPDSCELIWTRKKDTLIEIKRTTISV